MSCAATSTVRQSLSRLLFSPRNYRNEPTRKAPSLSVNHSSCCLAAGPLERFGHKASPKPAQRRFSEFRRGTDLLADSLAFGEQPKIILEGSYPTGFDLLGMLEQSEVGENDEEKLTKSPTLHMNGSIIAFPHSCFLWNVSGPKDVTIESLSVVVLKKPAVEILFIGSDKSMPPREVNKIKKEMKKRGIVVEHLDLVRNMGPTQ